MTEAIIKCNQLGKKYKLGKREKYFTIRDTLIEMIKWPYKIITQKEYRKKKEFWALKDVSFEVNKGEAIGIIGRNGAGKTTILKILSKITEPTEGRAEIRGRVASLLEVGTGFHDELTGRENIYLNGAVLGMKKKEIDSKFEEIVDFSGVKNFLDTPIKRYSSGMKVRLAFSVAAHLEPEILLIDEVLAVGDDEFQKKCLGKMDEVTRKQGRTILFVSHNMSAIQNLCSRCILLDQGKLIEDSKPSEVIEKYIKDEKVSINDNITTTDPDFRISKILIDKNHQQPLFNHPIKIDFHLELNKAYQNVRIGVTVINSVGAKIITSTCNIPKLDANKQKLSVILKNHYLPPGHYSLTFGIEQEIRGIVFRENALNFQISAKDINDSFLIKRGERADKLGVYLPGEYILN